MIRAGLFVDTIIAQSAKAWDFFNSIGTFRTSATSTMTIGTVDVAAFAAKLKPLLPAGLDPTW
jgi:hypothetical protein